MLLDQNTVLIRTGQYANVLSRLGSCNILETPTISKLIENKSSVPKAYKELQKFNDDNKSVNNFERLEMIQYFCYLSTAHLINYLKKIVLPREGNTHLSLTKWAWMIIENYKFDKIHTKNLLRFFDTYAPFYLILKSLISDGEYTKINSNSNDLLDQMKCTSSLSAFIELIIYKEKHDTDKHSISVDTCESAMIYLKSLCSES